MVYFGTEAEDHTDVYYSFFDFYLRVSFYKRTWTKSIIY